MPPAPRTRSRGAARGTPLFNFRLAPVSDWPGPWNWYYLTHGCFWIQAGPHQLFRYTPRILARWGMPGHPPWDDYTLGTQLTCSMTMPLPAILSPVPREMRRWVGSLASDARWRALAARYLEAGPDGDESGDVYHAAMRWTGERELEMGYLRFGHRIYALRLGDTISLRWFGAGVKDGPVRVWSAPSHGQVRMPVDAYIGEVRSFCARLLRAMAARPAACRRAGIGLDEADFREEHAARRREFDEAMGHAARYRPDYPWDEVVAACERIERWGLRVAGRRRRPPADRR